MLKFRSTEIPQKVFYLQRCFAGTVLQKQRRIQLCTLKFISICLLIVEHKHFSLLEEFFFSLKKGTLKMKAYQIKLTFLLVLALKEALVDERKHKELQKTSQ